MHLPDSLFTSTYSEQLRSFVKNLLDTVEKQSVQIERQRVQIDQLIEENEQLRAEIRHLKKHKGKPKIRPNVADKGDNQEDSSSKKALIRIPKTRALIAHLKVNDHDHKRRVKLLHHQ